jgi:hypothetical protein
MDRYRLRVATSGWIEELGFTQSAMLAFNKYGITRFGAIHHLKHFHALMDDLILGNGWAKRDPITERMFSISFIEHPTTNLHLHMLWRSQKRHEAILIEAMPGLWKSTVKSGKAENRAIGPDDRIFWYDTKELTDDSYILSTEFSSIPSHHAERLLSNAG